MPTFLIELRGAKPTNGHSGAPPLTGRLTIEAESWFASRVAVARRYGLDEFDPAMLSIQVETPKKKRATPKAPQ